jgi:flagellar hook protein FlgE
MTGFQALIVGISGLQTQSNVIGIIADNLANVSTVGYKKSGALFQNLLGSESVSSYSPGGSTSLTRYLNNAQGIIVNTTSATDLAISGTGFFPVRQTTEANGAGDILYTRAGAFVPNADGDFINGAGFFLQGWLLQDEELSGGLAVDIVDSATGIAALQTVNVSTLTEVSIPTTLVSLKANLTASKPNYAGTPAYDATNILTNMSDGSVAPTFTRPLTVIDSLGAAHSLTVGFLKTGANAWAIEVYATDVSELGVASAQIASGTATFNGDGTLASVSGSITTPVAISWALPDPATNSITFDWGTAGIIGVGDAEGLSQLDAPFQSSAVQNGFAAGSLSTVSITDKGVVVGHYDNGLSRNLYQIPLAIFTEQNQLLTLSGNIFTETTRSGDVNFVQPGEGGFGTLFSSALESSNVDTASQLTDMIVAQRSYQFNTRIVSTADDMLRTTSEMGA